MTLRFLEMVAQQYPDEYAHIRRITNLDQVKESARWRHHRTHVSAGRQGTGYFYPK